MKANQKNNGSTKHNMIQYERYKGKLPDNSGKRPFAVVDALLGHRTTILAYPDAERLQ